jgi:hypothetical protein
LFNSIFQRPGNRQRHNSTCQRRVNLPTLVNLPAVNWFISNVGSIIHVTRFSFQCRKTMTLCCSNLARRQSRPSHLTALHIHQAWHASLALSMHQPCWAAAIHVHGVAQGAHRAAHDRVDWRAPLGCLARLKPPVPSCLSLRSSAGSYTNVNSRPSPAVIIDNRTWYY